MSEDRTFICCFCGKEIKGWGNNPYPVETDENAECCDDCNLDIVLPARIIAMAQRGEEDE